MPRAVICLVICRAQALVWQSGGGSSCHTCESHETWSKTDCSERLLRFAVYLRIANSSANGIYAYAWRNDTTRCLPSLARVCVCVRFLFVWQSGRRGSCHTREPHETLAKCEKSKSGWQLTFIFVLRWDNQTNAGQNDVTRHLETQHTHICVCLTSAGGGSCYTCQSHETRQKCDNAKKQLKCRFCEEQIVTRMPYERYDMLLAQLGTDADDIFARTWANMLREWHTKLCVTKRWRRQLVVTLNAIKIW